MIAPLLLGFTEFCAGLLMLLALAFRLTRPERWGWTVGLMLALFARADNFYQGFLLLPHWFAGYALVPRGIGQVRRAVSSPRR